MQVPITGLSLLQEVLAWQHGEGETLLGLALAYGQRECAELLLAGSSPTSLCGGGGNTVLHVAAMSLGGVSVLRKLLSGRGAGGTRLDPALLEVRNR